MIQGPEIVPNKDIQEVIETLTELNRQGVLKSVAIATIYNNLTTERTIVTAGPVNADFIVGSIEGLKDMAQRRYQSSDNL